MGKEQPSACIMRVMRKVSQKQRTQRILRGMKSRLLRHIGEFPFYESTEAKYQIQDGELSSKVGLPLSFKDSDIKDLHDMVEDYAAFIRACIKLYHSNPIVKELLDYGKPEVFKRNLDAIYPVIKADVVLHSSGFRYGDNPEQTDEPDKACELDSGSFNGGAQADVYARLCKEFGFDPLIPVEKFRDSLRKMVGNRKVIVLYCTESEEYRGQYEYLAKLLDCKCVKVDENFQLSSDIQLVYRAFPLYAYETNPFIRSLLGTTAPELFVPSLTPQFEEKALLALLWDIRFREFFIRELGQKSFWFLRKIIPMTWIVGNEKFLDIARIASRKNVPGTITLMKMIDKNLRFVIKVSGYSPDERGAKGVRFVQKMSSEELRSYIREIKKRPALFIAQQLIEATPRSVEALNSKNKVESKKQFVRFTLFFNLAGEWLTQYVTTRGSKLYIHGTMDCTHSSATLRRTQSQSQPELYSGPERRAGSA